MTEEEQKIFDEYTSILNTLNVTLTDADKHFSANPTFVDLCNMGSDLYDPFANMNPSAPLTLEECEDLINSDEVNDLLNLDLSGLLNGFNDLSDNIDEVLKDNKLNNLLNNVSDYNNGDGDDVPDNYAIVEFGDDYILDKAVDYSLFIKPGDYLNSDTLIGIVDLNGNKIMKSIFATGYVMEKLEDHSFYHVYEGKADRHFVIHGYTLSDSDGLSYEDQQEITNMVSDNLNLYNLIKDHAVYGTLPIILANHETKKQHPTIIPCTKKHGNDIYSDIIEKYENYLSKAGTELQTLCSEDKIKATGGKSSSMKELGDLVIDVRETILNTIIGFYKEAGEDTICIKDVTENWLSLSGYSVNLDKKTGNIFNSLYQNYYVYLLSNVDISLDNKYYNEYYNLLNEIILNRLSKEYLDIDELTDLFNSLYKSYIDKSEPNGYQIMVNKFGDSTDTLAVTISNWLTTITYFKDDTDSNVQSNLNRWCTMLANMFLYINNISSTYVSDNTKTLELKEDDLITLTEEEGLKIKNFWDSKILEYQDNPLNAVIEKLNNKANEITEKAVWPQPMDITIDGITYAHYLFKNPFIDENSKNGNDGDAGNGAAGGNTNDGDAGAYTYACGTDTTLPSGTVPSSPSEDEGLAAMDRGDAALDSDNDPGEEEITVVETKYWQKYYSLATVISLPFLADGFDIPPTMTPVPMPCIFVCIKAIHIKALDVVMVLGLGIRGIYIYPIVQVNNLSSNYLSALTPLIAALKKVKAKFDACVDKIENTIPNISGLLIDKIQTDNAKYIQQCAEYEAAMHSLMNQAVEDNGIIKKQMDKLLHPNADHRLNIARTEKLIDD